MKLYDSGRTLKPTRHVTRSLSGRGRVRRLIDHPKWLVFLTDFEDVFARLGPYELDESITHIYLGRSCVLNTRGTSIFTSHTVTVVRHPQAKTDGLNIIYKPRFAGKK